MLEQTPDQRAKNSIDIEKLLQNDLKATIESLYSKYGEAFDHKLGMSKDDIINDMRIQIWKGLLNFKPERNVRLKTYLDNLVKNRFNTFRRRASLKKYNSVDYFKNVFNQDGVTQEHFQTEETGETILERRQELMGDLVLLTDTERKVLSDLILGFTLDEMVKRNALQLREVIACINRIDSRLKERRLRG